MWLPAGIQNALERVSPRNLALPAKVREQVIAAERSASAVVARFRDAVEAHVDSARNSSRFDGSRTRDQAFDAASAAQGSARAGINSALAALPQIAGDASQSVARRLVAARLIIEGAGAAAFAARSHHNDLSAPLRVFDDHVAGDAQVAASLQRATLPKVHAAWDGDTYVRLTMSPEAVRGAQISLHSIRDAVAAQLEVDRPAAASSAFTAIRKAELALAWDSQMSPEAIRSRRDGGAQYPTEFAPPSQARGTAWFDKVLFVNYASGGNWITLAAHDSELGRELLARVVEIAGIPKPPSPTRATATS